MDNAHDDLIAAPGGFAPERSADSLAFEALWRGLPRNGLTPTRDDFRPADAVQYLPYLVLLDIDLDLPRFGIRLVGTGFEQRVQCRIDGLDHLMFMAPERRAGAVEGARLMLSQPCGLWQRMSLHYARGISEPAEVTAFPFAPGPCGEMKLMCYVHPFRRPIAPWPTDGQAMRVDTATVFTFLDLGAGVPEWQAPESFRSRGSSV